MAEEFLNGLEDADDFEDAAQDADVRDLFDRDVSAEMNAIRTLDLSLIETATEQASSRLDHSAVIAATVGGALAGALAAIIVSLF